MSKKPSAPARPASTPWALAKDLLAAPSRAAERLREDPEALPAALILYLVHLGVAVVFYSWKPTTFAMPQETVFTAKGALPQSPIFWAKVQAYGPLIAAALLFFLGVFARLLQGGRLALRLVACTALTVAPVLVLVLYAGGMAPKAAVGGLWLLVLAAMGWLARERPAQSWRSLAGLVLSIIVVNLALTPLFALSVLSGSERAYHGLEMAMLFWTLGLGTAVVSRLEGLGTARGFAALFLAMLAQLVFVVSLYFLGVVPMEILKALMSV